MKRDYENITNDEWQRKLVMMKNCNVQSKSKKMSIGTETHKGSFDGETNWHSYVQYINSVLKVIRNGEVDYCYFTYQIKDLLRYEPCLKAAWNEVSKYFEVSL